MTHGRPHGRTYVRLLSQCSDTMPTVAREKVKGGRPVDDMLPP